MTEKRLLTDEEKKKDPRFSACERIFPEFDCYSDGTSQINKDKIPPGFAYLMEKNKKAYEENKDILNAAMNKFFKYIYKDMK